MIEREREHQHTLNLTSCLTHQTINTHEATQTERESERETEELRITRITNHTIGRQGEVG